MRKKLNKEALDTGGRPDYINPKRSADIESGKDIGLPSDFSGDIGSSAYKKAFDKVKKIVQDGPNQNFAGGGNVQLHMAIFQLLGEVMELEQSIGSDYFEELAKEGVLDLPEFQTVKEMVEQGRIVLDVKLLTMQDMQQNMQQAMEEVDDAAEQDPEGAAEAEDELAFELADIDEEIFKRNFSNLLTQGAAVANTDLYRFYEDELTQIDPDLPKMYATIMSQQLFLYWTAPDEFADMATSGGDSSFEAGGGEEGDGKIVIKARGVIFPLLVHELVKGLYEYLTAFGIPQDRKTAATVLGVTDTKSKELVGMAVGPEVYYRLVRAVGTVDAKMLHYVIKELMDAPAVADMPDGFADMVKQILDPSTSEGYMRKLCRKIKADIDAYTADTEEQWQDPDLGDDDDDGGEFAYSPGRGPR